VLAIAELVVAPSVGPKRGIEMKTFQLTAATNALLGLLTLGALIACNPQQALASSVVDEFILQRATGFAPLMFNATDETMQYVRFTNVGGAPMNFTSGAVVLLEAPGEPGPSSVIDPAAAPDLINALFAANDPRRNQVSDVFVATVGGGCSLCVVFGSDGADSMLLNGIATDVGLVKAQGGMIAYLVENGTLQNVGSTFMQPANAVQVGSDIPEPATWLLMGMALASLSVVRLRGKILR
jgi:hypothetical protein